MSVYRFTAAYVKRVIDGDTIVVDIDMGMGIWRHDQHVRVLAYDAPERGTDLGKKAREHAREILPVGLKVTLVSHEWDKYGRLLAEVRSTGFGSLAAHMIEAGFVK